MVPKHPKGLSGTSFLRKAARPEVRRPLRRQVGKLTTSGPRLAGSETTKGSEPSAWRDVHPD